ncbi:MAG: NAD(P)-dependent oxidoreductase [Peptococcaceae bacterium]|nr:NAD(P)-dependent oxidoreductase [Peptococcaceae bacterium]
MRIVMLESLAVSEKEFMEKARVLTGRGHEVIFCGGGPAAEEEQKAMVKDADVLIIANSPLSAGVLRAADKLKMLSVGFTGVDHVAMEVCREKGVLVSNAQGYCTDAVAELTMGLILACLRNILPCDNRTRTGKTREGLAGFELKGKTIGIAGTGAIGCRVAELAKAFGCRLLGYSRSRRPEALTLGIQYMPLDQLLKNSDIVSLHLPATPETTGLIDGKKLALMKPGAILINVGRGSVVDSAALADALNSDRIAAAGIDVYEKEPPLNADHPLFLAKNAVLTPHVAFATRESMLRRVEIVLENISSWMDGNPVRVCK